jgi:sugar lactone lactonase YvrE
LLKLSARKSLAAGVKTKSEIRPGKYLEGNHLKNYQARRPAVLVALTVVASLSLLASRSLADYGDLFVSDATNKTITKVTPTGNQSPYASSSLILCGLDFDRYGNLYVAASDSIVEYTPDAAFSSKFADVHAAIDVALDRSGNIFASSGSSSNGSIYKFTPGGTKTTFLSGLYYPTQMAFDGLGNLFLIEGANIVKIAPNGTKTTFATNLNGPEGITVDRKGQVYVAEYKSGNVLRFSRDGSTHMVFASDLAYPDSLACDDNGNIVVGDYTNHSVFRYTSDGVQDLVIPGNNPVGLRFEPAMGFPLNVSTRLNVKAGDDAAIAGVIVTGPGQKKLMFRAIGPSLSKAGITGAVQNPILELRASNGTVIATNDNWKQSSAASEIQASGVAPTDDRESAIIVTTYATSLTAIMRGVNSTTGVGLVEVYDLTTSNAAHIANISTRGSVETGDKVMIAGFIVGGGNGVSRVLVRVLGPSLANFGIAGALQNPTLTVRNANGFPVGYDNDWKQYQQAEIEQTGLAPSDNRESAAIMVLPAGNYTAAVSGLADTTGIALVEVYNLQ